jgi:hypothetical protein
MTDNLSMLGNQMAHAWRSILESWWRSMLQDPNQLSELRSRLSEMGQGGLGVGDMAKLLQALEILDRRLGAVESQMAELASGLSSALKLLEKRESPRKGK